MIVTLSLTVVFVIILLFIVTYIRSEWKKKKSLPFCFRYYSRETALRNVFTFVQLHVDPQQKMEDVSFPSPIEFSVGADKTNRTRYKS